MTLKHAAVLEGMATKHMSPFSMLADQGIERAACYTEILRKGLMPIKTTLLL